MAADGQSEIMFSIPQRTLPWQTISAGFKLGTEFRRHSVDGVSVWQKVQLIRWTQAVASGAAGRATDDALCPTTASSRLL